MNNKKGITLIVLVITIVVLIILSAIAINFGTTSIEETKEQKAESELSIIQTAVFQKYSLLKSKNQTGIISNPISSNVDMEDDPSRPKDLIGTRLAGIDFIYENGFEECLKEYYAGDTNLAYEDYYYYLRENDLEKLGIFKPTNDTKDYSEHRYVVHYQTGEVFDLANNNYYNKSISLEGGNNSVSEPVQNFLDE